MAGQILVKPRNATVGGIMPAKLVIVHDDAQFIDAAQAALRRDGHDVVGLCDAMVALAALEAAQRVEILITTVETPAGQPNGVSLALMARSKRRGVKVLFVGREEAKDYTEGVGVLLIEPVTAETIAEQVRQMLGGKNNYAA